MAVKVFTQVPSITGYINLPADAFEIVVPFTVYQSEGGDSGNPRSFSDSACVQVPLGSAAPDVYAAAYAMIVAACQAQGYPEPAISDCFTFAPTNFAAALTAPPSIA